LYSFGIFALLAKFARFDRVALYIRFMFDVNFAGRSKWSRKREDGGASTCSGEKSGTCSNGWCGLL